MPTTPQHTFPKAEKLCSDRAIEQLFAEGASTMKYPLRSVYRPNGGEQTHVLISVSKKRFKHAVDRNRVKRLIREAFRLNKQLLAPTAKLDLAFIFIGNRLPDFATISKSVTHILERINNDVNGSQSEN